MFRPGLGTPFHHGGGSGWPLEMRVYVAWGTTHPNQLQPLLASNVHYGPLSIGGRSAYQAGQVEISVLLGRSWPQPQVLYCEVGGCVSSHVPRGPRDHKLQVDKHATYVQVDMETVSMGDRALSRLASGKVLLDWKRCRGHRKGLTLLECRSIDQTSLCHGGEVCGQ